MYKIKEEFTTEIEIKKSIFISYLMRVESEQEAKEYIQKIRKIHPDATHHCYAYIIKEIQRSNDDGEPGNSAGIPILKELIAAHLTSAVCVVVRYFRGIKLGVGGLIRAYSSSAKETISIAKLYQLIKINQYQIIFDYPFIDKIEYLLSNNKILEKKYEEKVSYIYLSLEDYFDKLNELTSGSMTHTFQKEVEIEIEKEYTKKP